MEPRLAAAISHGGVLTLYDRYKDRAEDHGLAGHMKWVFGADSMKGVAEKTRKFDLRGAFENMKCPYLILHGGHDVLGVEAAKEGYQYAKSVGVDVTFESHIYPDGFGVLISFFGGFDAQHVMSAMQDQVGTLHVLEGAAKVELAGLLGDTLHAVSAEYPFHVSGQTMILGTILVTIVEGEHTAMRNRRRQTRLHATGARGVIAAEGRTGHRYTAGVDIVTLFQPVDAFADRDFVVVTRDQAMPAHTAIKLPNGVALADGPSGRLTLEGERIALDTADGRLDFASVYPALGSVIRSDLARGLSAKMTDDGCLLVGDHQRTSVAGLYAAGDVVKGLDQISHAVGEGGVAATTIRNDLAERTPLLRATRPQPA
eukprot:gene25295-biopygen16386